MIIIGSIGVLYLSWLSNPNIGSQPYFPRPVGHWINENWNLRTAVPFIFLAALAELNFVENKAHLYRRTVIAAGLLVLVVLAEVGQLFIANRHFDVGDILWGFWGSMVGIAVGYLGKLIFINKGF